MLALRRIHDAATAARRWNLLLHELDRTPDASLLSGLVPAPGKRRPQPGWTVVDPRGVVRAAATDTDRSAWCAALRAAGIDVAPVTGPSATAAGRSTM